MKLKSATVGDIALSIVLPIVGLIGGLIALVKREYKRSITMLALSVGMLAILAVPVALMHVEGNEAFRDPYVELSLAVAADRVNLSAPRMIDRVTRLDGANAGPGLVLTYRYTLVHLDSRRVDTGVLAARLKRVLTQRVCASKKLGILLRKNVMLKFLYRLKNGTTVADVAVDRQACDTQ